MCTDRNTNSLLFSWPIVGFSSFFFFGKRGESTSRTERGREKEQKRLVVFHKLKLACGGGRG